MNDIVVSLLLIILTITTNKKAKSQFLASWLFSLYSKKAIISQLADNFVCQLSFLLKSL